MTAADQLSTDYSALYHLSRLSTSEAGSGVCRRRSEDWWSCHVVYELRNFVSVSTLHLTIQALDGRHVGKRKDRRKKKHGSAVKVGHGWVQQFAR